MAEDAAVTPQEEATPAERHPLASVTETIGTWTRWKEQWEATVTAEHKLSLLHYGFMVATDNAIDRVDRICFYLDVADGHNHPDNFRIPGDRMGHSYPTPRFLGEKVAWDEIRRRIARKAFEMVASTSFKDRPKSSYNPSWAWILKYTELIDKILWFFRVDAEEPRIGNFPNRWDEGDIYSKITHIFLVKLAELAWTFDSFGMLPADSDRKIRQQLREQRPRFIEILWGIGELGKLLSRDYKLDRACLAKLEELAFRSELLLPTEEQGKGFWSGEWRKPQTLAEAHYGGSMPAIVLTHRRIVAQEEERFEKLRELSERRDELERERAALETTEKTEAPASA